MGEFVAVTGLPPSVYWSLTLSEHNAIIEAHNRMARRKK